MCGEYGKLYVAGRRLEFNASDSCDIAMYAFTEGCGVGVDVEAIRPMGGDFEGISRSFFSAEEAEELASLPSAARLGAFFRCWTRKEAFVKAIGGGLSIPLDSFRVSMRLEESPRLLRAADQGEDPRVWTFHHVEPAPRYVGAVAYKDSKRPLKVFGPIEAIRILCCETR
jgi:4'-phosphopantetheinyl transferase